MTAVYKIKVTSRLTKRVDRLRHGGSWLFVSGFPQVDTLHGFCHGHEVNGYDKQQQHPLP